MCLVALLVFTPNWKQPKCSLTRRWVNKVIHPYSAILFCNKKRNSSGQYCSGGWSYQLSICPTYFFDAFFLLFKRWVNSGIFMILFYLFCGLLAINLWLLQWLFQGLQFTYLSCQSLFSVDITLLYVQFKNTTIVLPPFFLAFMLLLLYILSKYKLQTL